MTIGKPSIRNIGKPRPKIMKAIGDTMIYAGTAVTGSAIYTNNPLMGYIALGCMVLGNLFTNLYAASIPDNEEDKNNNPDS